ncbi:hypothetical protein CPB83DRAFT_304602 [Crepidotus variabilis]|uniref:NAD(P)-binding protein n=1 Tax=Crepidotus variabilis TaxID=179855 RepID=A0A9P6EGK3_9AGAR|nr:hypothetical protein CPB83DRAFT_304602 [Crepidotus variabilis]
MLSADERLRFNVKFVQIEVTSDQSVNAARDTIEAAEGRLDSLVNNAGITGGVSLTDEDSVEVSIATIQDTINTNFIGTVRVCNTFLPILHKASGTPTILNISGDTASNRQISLAPTPMFFTPYNASKAAVNSYTITLAVYLKDAGFKINAATPGFTSTKLTGNRGKPAINGALASLPWVVLGEDGPNGKFFAEDGKTEPEW